MGKRTKPPQMGFWKSFLLFLSLSIFLPATILASTPQNNPGPPGTPPATLKPRDGDTRTIKTRVQSGILQHPEVAAFHIFDVTVDSIEFSKDRNWAVAWLGFKNRRSQHPVPTEPGLAIARRSEDDWEITLPPDRNWSSLLKALPEELLSLEAKQSWLRNYKEHLDSLVGEPLGGYYLPWPGGETKYLTRSISHGIGGSMFYAFDFAEPGYPSDQFPIYAARDGLVKFAEWTYPDGYFDGTCGHANYLVLEDQSTNPTTYALYLHLAKDTIPTHMRQIGSPVYRGEYIGHADDTGCSTGNHLHFQVHTNPYSYWGDSVDITFMDVAINGGRPRTPSEASNYPQYGSIGQNLYTSQNTAKSDFTPPFGDLNLPVAGFKVDQPQIAIQGWADDLETGLSHTQLLAYFNNAWHPIGPLLLTHEFTYTWNICDDSLPEGPVSLAAKISDQDGNTRSLVGLRHITNYYKCPSSPACSPDSNQVALFSGVNYQGDCGLFSIGDFPDLEDHPELGDDRASSILLGENLQATVFTGSNYSGRGQTIFTDNRNLSDDLVGNNQVSSLKIRVQGILPQAPEPLWPAQGTTFTTNDSISLLWRDNAGAAEYLAVLVEAGQIITSTVTRSPHWNLGSLPTGNYSWKIAGRNQAGQGAWSESIFIGVHPGDPLPGSTHVAPWMDDMETNPSQWISTGLWHWADDAGHTHSGSHGWWYGSESTQDYATPDPNAGDLTSPPILIPGPGYSLRFWSWYETESANMHWDQRWLQISANGGPYRNILQLSDDAQRHWLQSPFIDLSGFSGQTIRLRFRFETLDSLNNNFHGWIIDDVEISMVKPPACGETGEPNDSPDESTVLPLNTVLSGEICPPGDMDFYTFEAESGDRIVVDVDAQSIGSPLDPFLFLYDTDGKSLLASHDDEILYEKVDSHLGYFIPTDGRYFLKLKAWAHPRDGTPDHQYTIDIQTDPIRPDAHITLPENNSFLPSGITTVDASIQDHQSGVSHVEFFWHSGDWSSSPWVSLSEDWDPQDGWHSSLDSVALPDQDRMAFFIKAYDWAGNWAGDYAWDVNLDRTPPETNLAEVDPMSGSTAVKLTWTSFDQIAGVDRVDIQMKKDLSEWTSYAENVPNVPSALWFIGEPDTLYAFRMRGIDYGGNVEAYPSSEETRTLIQGCTNQDLYEPDNQSSTSTYLLSNTQPQTHNFCKFEDQDWFRFNVNPGIFYWLQSQPTDESVAIAMRLYASDASTIIAQSVPQHFGDPTRLGWKATSSSLLFLKLEHIDGRVAGDNTEYQISFHKGVGFYLPSVFRSQ